MYFCVGVSYSRTAAVFLCCGLLQALMLSVEIGPMTGCAILRRGFVEQNLFPIDPLGQFVTLIAAGFLMRTLQCKCGSLVVVEQSRFPFRAVMARDTTRTSVLRELLAMNIFVAVFALSRCFCEIDVGEFGP